MARQSNDNDGQVSLFVKCDALLIINKLHADSSISLQVQPTTLTKNGEWVTVTWEGVSSPSKKDWIGVYSPPANNAYGINATKNAPIKYQVYHGNDVQLTTLLQSCGITT